MARMPTRPRGLGLSLHQQNSKDLPETWRSLNKRDGSLAWGSRGWLYALVLFAGAIQAADYPAVEISNGQIRALVPAPGGEKAYYRGTRFDWSGLITSLESQGHTYFAPFYEKFDPSVRDVDFKTTVLAGRS